MNRSASRALLLGLTLATLGGARAHAADLHAADAQWRDESLLSATADADDKSLELVTRNHTTTSPDCRGEVMMFGYLPATRQMQTQPTSIGYDHIRFDGAQYYARGIKFCLEGPAGTDFDLYVDKYDPMTGSWVTVASSRSGAPDETIDIGLVGGDYRARIENYSGSGPYVLLIDGRLVDLIRPLG
jgi:hypothetical protein